MNAENDEVFANFMIEMSERLSDIETDLTQLATAYSVEVINRLFRAIHTIKGGSGFFGLNKITALTHVLEDLLMQIREGDVVFKPEMMPSLFSACDTLKDMHEAADYGNALDIDGLCNELKAAASKQPAGATASPAAGGPPPREPATRPPRGAAQAPTHSAHAESAAAVSVAMPTSSDADPKGDGPAAEPDPVPMGKPKAGKDKHAVETIRVRVDLLDRLMELTGEIVVGRNQLVQQFSGHDNKVAISSMAHMISDLQQVVLQTRMQPVAGTFTKFNKIVRDLAKDLKKNIQLVIKGDETEVDRSIIESLSDPLTHLIRNCADHGAEPPDIRIAKGKSSIATVWLEAKNEGGQVAITVEDDGNGIDIAKVKAKAVAGNFITPHQAAEMGDSEAANLVFLPGLSTAEHVTSISGRGVGMDVVKSTVEKLGGAIDLETQIGAGTKIIIYLPTTLTIMSSLIVWIGKDRFAVPHSDLREVIQIHPADEVQIERVMDRTLYRLRGSLIPVFRMSDITGEPERDHDGESPVDHAHVLFLVLKSGTNQFGLVIDSVDHTEEIVIKPLPQNLKNQSYYAGSSILGDSDIAMVLSANGICQTQNLHTQDRAYSVHKQRTFADSELVELQEKQDLLVFKHNHEDQFAIPLSLVFKVEHIRDDQVETISDKRFVTIEGRNILLIYLDRYLTLKPIPKDEPHLCVIITKINKFEVGIVATSIEESIHARLNLDTPPLNEQIILGVTKFHDRLTFLLDLFSLAELVDPQGFKTRVFKEVSERNKLLVVDDTPFFRNLEKKYFESLGFQVTLACNGKEALDMLLQRPHGFDLVVTDIVMPVMDGYGLVKNIKSTPTLMHLPVIALTSFAEEEHQEKAMAAGFSGYALKTNKETIMQAVESFVQESH